MAEYLLALDQGTTSTRAIIDRAQGLVPVATARLELPQDYLASAGSSTTNQRETTVIWDRSSGKPIHRAIVWRGSVSVAGSVWLRRCG